MPVSSITRMVAADTGCHVLGFPIALISRIPRCSTTVEPRLSDWTKRRIEHDDDGEDDDDDGDVVY